MNSDASRLPRVVLALSTALLTTLSPVTVASAEENVLPVGHHDDHEGMVDGIRCRAFGWAVDPDEPNARLLVRVSVDGDVVATLTADLLRDDLPPELSDGNSGWGIDLRQYLSKDEPHEIRAEAQDAQSGAWQVLTGSPKTITCANSNPDGTHEGSAGAVLRHQCRADGWAMDPDVPAEIVDVRVLVDGMVTVEGPADAFRDDLIAAGSSPHGFAGFGFDLWGAVRPNAQHEVRVQARDPQTLAWTDIEGTPTALRCVEHGGSSPFIGRWSATDVDGSTMMLTISGGAPNFHITYTDEFATVCAVNGAPTTKYRADGSGVIVDLFVLVVNMDGGCGSYQVGFPPDWEILYDVPTGQLLTDGETIAWTPIAAAQ